MRIISQDGMIDIPYENFVFAVTGDNYIVAIRDTIARPCEIVKGVVAKYSIEAKAKRPWKYCMKHMWHMRIIKS